MKSSLCFHNNAFVVAAFALLALIASPLHAEYVTVNPLVNAGGELGNMTGWSTGTVSTVSGSLTFSGKTFSATEGDYWFMHEGISTWSGHTYNYQAFTMTQTIDVSEFSAICSISYSADFQSAGNGYDFEYNIWSVFYDADGNRLGSDFPWDDATYDSGDTTISRIATSIPSGAATIVLWVTADVMAVNSGDNLIGVDNIQMTINGYIGAVPEPASMIMLSFATLVSGMYWFRKK